MNRTGLVPPLALALTLAFAAALALAATPALGQNRVLSIGGAATEIVYGLGAGRVLVGVDQTSTYPPAAKSLPSVGYVRTLAAEGMLSLNPDLVLLVPEAGPPAALKQAGDAGLRLVRLPGGLSEEALITRIRAIGATLHHDAEGRAMADAVKADIDQVRTEVAKLRGKPRVIFLMGVGRGSPLAAGTATAADTMIAMAGGENAMSGFSGYKPLSPEAAVAAAPDVLLMFQHVVDELGGPEKVLALPELASTKAAQDKRLVAMDATYMLGFGPRLAQATRDLAIALHPGQTLPPLPPRSWAPG